MRFKLANRSGKPVVISAEDGVVLAQDLGEMHRVMKQYNLTNQEEGYWFGVAAVLFASLSLLKWGNSLSQTNLMKALDEFYFSFTEDEIEQAFQSGISDAIDLTVDARLEDAEADITNRLAARLGY